ncbi:hypothetical protein DRO69_11080 [Candidatus Bathyarchaeota archaeon]|nr:MAG: hypothetical protein DRO69_11080 [Candidatus Bathyarchaeota archaeon]
MRRKNLLVEKLNPAERALFIQFLKERYPERHSQLADTNAWDIFKSFCNRLLNEYWSDFSKWLDRKGIR